MVKYQKINIAMNGKSNGIPIYREPGSKAESLGGVGTVKVRPGANFGFK